jgi:hypothetical protein
MSNILDPVARVMNEFLTVWYTENNVPGREHKFIRVRAQYTGQPDGISKSNTDACH